MDQILTLGLLYIHGLFPYERSLAVLKAYVRNRAHLQGCIMEGYTTKEVAECYVNYVKDGKWIGLPIPLHKGRLGGNGRMGQKAFVDTDYILVSESYFSILQQVTIAGPNINEHLSELRRDNRNHIDAWIMKEHRYVFTTWLMDKDIPTKELMMKLLASRRSSCVTS
jgi:hypothetical protein